MNYSELSKLTDEELVGRYDAIAESTVVGLAFYREEIARREQARQNRLVVRLTFANAAFAGLALVASIVAVLTH